MTGIRFIFNSTEETCSGRPSSHLQTLGLLANLHGVLASEFPLPPLVVLLLVGELGLVLQADQLSPGLLDVVELAELQLLHRFVVPEQHGVFQILLGLTLVQLLSMRTGKDLFKATFLESRSTTTQETALPPLELSPARCCGERSGSSV